MEKVEGLTATSAQTVEDHAYVCGGAQSQAEIPASCSAYTQSQAVTQFDLGAQLAVQPDLGPQPMGHAGHGACSMALPRQGSNRLSMTYSPAPLGSRPQMSSSSGAHPTACQAQKKTHIPTHLLSIASTPT